MDRTIILTNPASDPVTMYLDAWKDKIVDFAKKQENTSIFELNNKNANREELFELISKKNPHFIIINGHGSEDCVCGFNGDILVKSSENEEILSNTIVHSLTCSSGKILGPSCVKAGTLAYIGYKEDFQIVYLRNKETREEKFNDEIAKLFLEPAFEPVFSLIEGCSVTESFNRSQLKYLEILKITIAKNHPGLNTAVAPKLFHNLTNQVCLGDGAVSF